jgi:hypothetical protein
VPEPQTLVGETTTTTGTSDLTTVAENGRQRFSTAFGIGTVLDVFEYYVAHRTLSEWEHGTGHMSATSTLVRDTVIESSNANALVSFSAGTKDVYNGISARDASPFGASSLFVGASFY